MWLTKKQIYDNNDVQKMLNFLHYNKTAKNFFFTAIIGFSVPDKRAMLHAVDEAWYEVFDRYDSAVCDYFVKSFEECFLKRTDIAQYKVLDHSDHKYKVIDWEDGVVDTFTISELVEATRKGLKIDGFKPPKLARL